MESFPAQSPEVSIDDDDDDSPDSSRERRNSRDEAIATASAKQEKNQEPEPAIVKEVEKKKNEEGEIPLEVLADEELQMVAQQYIDNRTESLKDEVGTIPENSPEEAALLANATLLETIDDKLSQGAVPSEQVLAEAIAETAQELGIELPETEDQNSADPEISNQPEASETVEDPQDPPDPVATGPVTSNPSGNRPGQKATANPPTTAGPGPAPAAPGSPIGAGAGNNLPPAAPVRSYGGGPPFIPNYNTNAASPNPNISPANTPNALEQTIVKHNAAAPYLLLGYLIGRRRGRIKTEEKLLPVQKKLEKQVTDLHKTIAAGEEKIRKLAWSKAEEAPGAAAKMAERVEERKKAKAERPKGTELPASDKEVKIKPEKLGMLAVKKETPNDEIEVRPTIKEKPKVAEVLKVPERPKDPLKMSVAELLVIAAQIPAEHRNVKKLYETHLLTEQGLREITQAYLKGERYDRVIHKNRTAESPDFAINPETTRSADSQDAYMASDKSSFDATRTQSEEPWTSRTAAQAPKGSARSSDSVRKQAADKSARPTLGALAAAVTVAVIILLLFLLR